MKFKLALGTVVVVMLGVFQISHGQETASSKRLSLAEIEALPPAGAGAGTSGVNGIQTRVLKGDPNKAGLYTI